MCVCVTNTFFMGDCAPHSPPQGTPSPVIPLAYGMKVRARAYGTGVNPRNPPPTARPHELQFLYLLHLLHLLHVLHGHLLFRFLILLSWREYVSFSSALMQQIKIANINANEPAITISSPINAGMLVMINSKYLCLFCLI